MKMGITVRILNTHYYIGAGSDTTPTYELPSFLYPENLESGKKYYNLAAK